MPESEKCQKESMMNKVIIGILALAVGIGGGWLIWGYLY